MRRRRFNCHAAGALHRIKFRRRGLRGAALAWPGAIAQAAVRLQLHVLAYILAIACGPRDAEVVSHGRYVTFQMAEVAVPRQMFRKIWSLINRLRTAPAARVTGRWVRYDTQI